MKLREILSYIPKEQLRMFALEYQVDRQVKKLSGEVMFYLLLFSSLNVRHNSL
ncbi:IS4/IS5 family transposase, partial [Aggregatibacter actinomycetemcomitans]|nr:IS4/IS5 family transposase [Aggregatibacter actinomycetemcomitans]